MKCLLLAFKGFSTPVVAVSRSGRILEDRASRFFRGSARPQEPGRRHETVQLPMDRYSQVSLTNVMIKNSF